MTMEEVWQIVKQIGSLKAPSPGGVYVVSIKNIGI